MKRIIILFILCWSLIGVILFIIKTPESDDTYELNIEAQEPLYWDLHNTGKGNYKPPFWLKNPDLTSYVEDKSHIFEEVKATLPNERLMSFFAQIQLGNEVHISSFIHPAIIHEDFTSFDIENIENQIKEYAHVISRNKTINKVLLSEPTQISENKVLFDATIHYDNSQVSISDIPMVMLTEDINWFLDIKLADFVELLENSR